MRRAHKGSLPVVEFDAIPMKTKVGTTLRPHFKIVDWKPGASNAEPAVQQLERPKQRNAYDDVPFEEMQY
jgi:hypothetical protein